MGGVAAMASHGSWAKYASRPRPPREIFFRHSYLGTRGTHLTFASDGTVATVLNGAGATGPVP